MIYLYVAITPNYHPDDFVRPSRPETRGFRTFFRNQEELVCHNAVNPNVVMAVMAKKPKDWKLVGGSGWYVGVFPEGVSFQHLSQLKREKN